VLVGVCDSAGIMLPAVATHKIASAMIRDLHTYTYGTTADPVQANAPYILARLLTACLPAVQEYSYTGSTATCVIPLETASSQAAHNFTPADVDGEVPAGGNTTVSTVSHSTGALVLGCSRRLLSVLMSDARVCSAGCLPHGCRSALHSKHVLATCSPAGSMPA